MYKILRLFLCLIFVGCFFNIKTCYARNIFYDDFNNKNENIWNYNYNGGSIDFDNSIMALSSTFYRFPVVINKTNELIPKTGDFDLSIRFKYNLYGFMGDGIGIGLTNSSGMFFYQFGIWQDKINGSFFYYNDFNTANQGRCNNFNQANDLIGRTYFPLNLSVNIWHVMEIKKFGSNYSVYIDPEDNKSPVYTTASNQCIPEFIWFGNKDSGGGNNWNNLSIDSLKIDTKQQRNKIIILPGLGASWNTEAFVYNNSGSEWKMTPFVNNYDGLISTLDGNGLIKNEDYFVWNYDWRKPIDEIVADFNNFVNNNIGTEDVDLVGHSLGGVVARVWKQDQINNNRNINVYTLGSPNNGSLDAYEAWSGGKISDSPNIESVAMNILLQLNKAGGPNNLSSFRQFMPILEDLLPTYDFVKKQNKIISINNLESKNNYLIQKNNEANGLVLDLKSYLGIGQKTKEYVNLANSTVFDNVLGVWPDGKLIDYSYGDGDNTVLKKNANLKINGDIIEINSGHREIVNKSLSDLVSKLNLDNNGSYTSDDYSDSLVIFVGSPVNYSVKCDNDDSINDVDGFVIIKNKNYKKCTMNLVGTGNGIYHLVYGNTNLSSDSWHYLEDSVQTDENATISFDPGSGEIVKDNSNIDFIKNLISDDLNLLAEKYGNNKFLISSQKSLKANDLNGLINNVFLFRKAVKENNLTVRILDNAEIWYEIFNKNDNSVTAKSNYLKIVQNKSLVDKITQLNYIKNIKPNKFSSESYLKANSLMEISNSKLNIKDYTATSANSVFAIKYLSEVW